MGFGCSSRKQLEIIKNNKNILEETISIRKDKHKYLEINDSKPKIEKPTPINKKNSLFKEEIIDCCYESSVIKPYLSSIIPPDDFTKNCTKSFNVSLGLSYVFGYRSYDVKQNIYWKNNEEIIYHAACVGIIHNIETNEQKFLGGNSESFKNKHNDEITCISYSNSTSQLFATGQIGIRPKILIWCLENNTPTLCSTFYQIQGSKQVSCLAFSNNQRYVSSIGADTNNTFFVFRISDNIMIWSEVLGCSTIFDMKWSLIDENEFCIVGVKSFNLCHLKDKTIKRGNFRKGKECVNTCVQYINNDIIITLTDIGMIYFWEDNLLKKSIKVSDSCLYVVCWCEISNNLYIGDSMNFLYCFDLKCEKVKNELILQSYVKAIDINSKGNLVVGLRNGTIQIIDSHDLKKTKIVNYGHHDGILKAIEYIPDKFIISAGHDNKIMLWDIIDKKFIREGLINVYKSDRNDYINISNSGCVDCISYNELFKHIAIGINNGCLSIRNDLFNLNKKLMEDILIGNITVMKYSANNNYLAVATNDNVLSILSVIEFYAKLYSINNQIFNICQIDWDVTSTYIQCVNIADYYFFLCVEKEMNTINPIDMRNVNWKTFTCKFGWPVQGIFNGNLNTNYINCVNQSGNERIILAGTNEMFLNLYHYPCIDEKPFIKQYLAHSDKITGVLYNHNSTLAITIGGIDKTIMIWKINFI